VHKCELSLRFSLFIHRKASMGKRLWDCKKIWNCFVLVMISKFFSGIPYIFISTWSTGTEPKELQELVITNNIPSKLLTSTGFSWKRFFSSKFLLGDPPWKKSTEHVKSRSSKCQNQNFYSEAHIDAKEEFPKVSKLPSGPLTSTGTNNSWRSSPPEKSIWQVYNDYCSKNIVGKCKKLKLP
jgi:hypothetical protein